MHNIHLVNMRWSLITRYSPRTPFLIHSGLICVAALLDGQPLTAQRPGVVRLALTANKFCKFRGLTSASHLPPITACVHELHPQALLQHGPAGGPTETLLAGPAQVSHLASDREGCMAVSRMRTMQP